MSRDSAFYSSVSLTIRLPVLSAVARGGLQMHGQR